MLYVERLDCAGGFEGERTLQVMVCSTRALVNDVNLIARTGNFSEREWYLSNSVSRHDRDCRSEAGEAERNETREGRSLRKRTREDRIIVVIAGKYDIWWGLLGGG